MGVHVYGRRAIRDYERKTGKRIVHAVDMRPGTVLTTIDHRHLIWDDQWIELAAIGDCGMWPTLSSCRILFGEPEHGFTRGLMRGPCKTCGAGCSMLHRADCAKLALILSHYSVNPDYWPKPVHRPAWLDDPRCPQSRVALTHRLAYSMDIPPELLMHDDGSNYWGWWTRSAEAIQRDVDGVVATIAPDMLREMGLDPERYTLEMDWQRGPYSPDRNHWAPWRQAEEHLRGAGGPQ